MQRLQLAREQRDAQPGALPGPRSLHGLSLPQQPRPFQPSCLGHSHVGCASPGLGATGHWHREPVLLPALPSRAASILLCPAGYNPGVPGDGLFEMLRPVPAAQRDSACKLPLQKSQETPKRGK